MGCFMWGGGSRDVRDEELTVDIVMAVLEKNRGVRERDLLPSQLNWVMAAVGLL